MQALLLIPFAVVKMGVWMKINMNPKRYLHLHIHPDIIYNSQDTETAWVLISGWMDKENVVYVQWNTCCCAVTKSCPTLCNPMDCTCQAPLSMGFSRQEYWSGLSFPPPEDLLDPWTEPTSPSFQPPHLSKLKWPKFTNIEDSVLVRSTDSRDSPPGHMSHLVLPGLWPWTAYFISANLHFSVCVCVCVSSFFFFFNFNFSVEVIFI